MDKTNSATNIQYIYLILCTHSGMSGSAKTPSYRRSALEPSAEGCPRVWNPSESARISKSVREQFQKSQAQYAGEPKCSILCQELLGMNNIFSITVGATLDHGTRAKKCAATCTNMCRNERNLGVGRSGHKLGRGPDMDRFRPSCVFS